MVSTQTGQVLLRPFCVISGAGSASGSANVGCFRRIQKFVKGAETAAGQNQLPTDLRVATAHEAKQFDLLLGVRRKIGVTALGCAHAITIAIPNEKSFAQTSPRREKRAS